MAVFGVKNLVQVIALSRAAHRDQRVFIAQHAYNAHQEACGWAMAGERAEVARTLGRADEFTERAIARQADAPPQPSEGRSKSLGPGRSGGVRGSFWVSFVGPTRHWRSADLLSHGTAEQIHLLLRVALADHLTRGHDTCPLLLDDVTVHADAARTRAILDLPLHSSTERQMVVFTQEEQIAAWARRHLTGPEHAIANLSPVAFV